MVPGDSRPGVGVLISARSRGGREERQGRVDLPQRSRRGAQGQPQTRYIQQSTNRRLERNLLSARAFIWTYSSLTAAVGPVVSARPRTQPPDPSLKVLARPASRAKTSKMYASSRARFVMSLPSMRTTVYGL